jgi:hypothetical protein
MAGVLCSNMECIRLLSLNTTNVLMTMAKTVSDIQCYICFHLVRLCLDGGIKFLEAQ